MAAPIPVNPFTLPTVKSTPGTDIEDYITFLFGPPSIGKTSFLSHFKDALFLMFEPSAKALRLYQKEISTWVDFKAAIKLLHANKVYKTVVVDTIDIAYRLCMEYVIKFKTAGIHPGEDSYGRGWDALKDEFQKTIAELCKTGKGVVFVSHVQYKAVKKMGGGEYEIICPSASDVARRIIEPMAHIFAYYHYGEDNKRYLKITGDSESMGGCKLKEEGYFKGVDVIPMGDSSAEAYKNFTDAFHSRLKVAPRVAVKPNGKTGSK